MLLRYLVPLFYGTCLVAACDIHPAAIVTYTATTTPYPTSTPYPTATPFQGVSPVATPAGWEDVTSHHWAGYTFPIQDVTGVRAQWREAAVHATDRSGAELFTWIGIGGWNDTNSNIIQAGTYDYFPLTGGQNTGFWYELIPASPVYFPLSIHPGDIIAIEITEVQPNQWRISMIDHSQPSAAVDVTVPYVSAHAYPSFVAEDPDSAHATDGDNGPFYPFPQWGPIHLSQIAIRSAGEWHAAASIYAYRVTMHQEGRTIATASQLDATSSFTLTRN